MQEVSSVYTSPFLDTDERNGFTGPRKLSGAFERRAPGPIRNSTICSNSQQN